MKATKLTKRMDGSTPLRDNQMPCEIYEQHKKTKPITENKVGFKGDGSAGIQGNINIKSKDAAINLVNGIIDQFNINKEELDL